MTAPLAGIHETLRKGIEIRIACVLANEHDIDVTCRSLVTIESTLECLSHTTNLSCAPPFCTILIQLTC